MNHTKIEWCDFTWNPITGCTYGCSYCYARRITERFPGNYPQGFDPMFWPDRVLDPMREAKPSRIFTCSMGDFWDSAINDNERAAIMETMIKCQWHRFLMLTKRPEKIHPPKAPWCLPNLWMGVTIDLPGMEYRAKVLMGHREMGITQWHPFVSFEPLLGEMNDLELDGIEWIIIGAMTNPYTKIDPDWVDPILKQADELKIPVFQKDNLHLKEPRREYPEELNFIR